MKKISNIPTITLSNVFDACVASFRDTALKERYISKKSYIINQSEILNRCFTLNTTHSISAHNSVGTAPMITKDEMKILYDKKLVSSNNGRPYYDYLMSLADNDLCPNCGVRRVRTLDHFMAKSKYPTFSITPINLYPCCSDCNKDKKSLIYSNYEDTPINPYYDDFSNIEWLETSLKIVGNLPVFCYNVSLSTPLQSTVINKLMNHCKTFNLFKLYAIEASSEYTNIKEFIRSYKTSGDINSLQTYFSQMYHSNRKVDFNSFKTSMYKCLRDNYVIIYNYL